MPALIERPKMTKAMYQALKRHIVKERERKKQELEQDALMERQRKEQELRKKKEQEDSLTLEQTKEQIQQLGKKLETLKQEKHELFSQLKKVLHQEDETRKRAQIKEQSELLSLQPSYSHHSIPASNHHAMLMSHGRPTLYRPQQPMMHQLSLKRPRSPSPPSSTVFQTYNEPAKIAPIAVAKQHPAFSHPTQGEYKSGNFQQTQPPTQATYANQPPSHNYPQPSGTAYTTSKSPAGKYQAASQSAFTSYPSHYPQHQQKPIQEPYPGYAVQRLQQPTTGYNIPLQQQLEHANQKAGFNEEKYKLQQQPAIRGAQQAGLVQQIQLQQQQQQSSKGSIMTGFSARGQAPPPSSTYQPTNPQNTYPGQQQGNSGRPQMPAQHSNRFY